MKTIIEIFSVVSIVFILIYMYYTTILMLISNKRMNLERELIKEFEYIFLIPCCNEELVIANTIIELDRLEYDKKEIILIDDDSEDKTVEVVKKLEVKSKINIIKRKKPNAQLGKGASLNYAYNIVRTKIIKQKKNLDEVIIVIVDADGRPSANLLQEANKAFSNKEVGAAQARISITNRKRILPMLQDIEFFTVVAAIQKLRQYFGDVCLGGNGQFTRMSSLEKVGENPWSKCLLEDFDLGLSILLKNQKIYFLEDAIMYQQGLTSMKKFIKQRSRWVQGNLQSRSRWREIKESKIYRVGKIDLIYFLLQPGINMINGIIFIMTIGLDFYIIFNSKIVFNGISKKDIILILMCLFIIFGNGIIWSVIHLKNYSSKNEKLNKKKVFLAGFVFPMYNIISIISVIMAYKRHILKKEGWLKTERIKENIK